MPKTTALYERHLALGAKMTEFAGWLMPVNYQEGPIAEHLRVRESAGLFDLAHMGQIIVGGPDALSYLQHLVTSNVARISEGKAGYAPLCYADGGVVDDAFIYHLTDWYLVVVNAANTDKDVRWFNYHRQGYDVFVEDVSAETYMLALQGPRAQEILQPLTTVNLDQIGHHEVAEGEIQSTEAVIGRTGYTGEDGFEIYFDDSAADKVWCAILEAGEPHGILPVGLAARDSLRFEPGMALYGNELTPDVTPLQARLSWAVALDKGDFIGREALLKERLEGSRQRLVGFRMVDRGVPRHGYTVVIDGESHGHVTSGMYAPSLDAFLGMAYVPSGQTRVGTPISIDIRGRLRQAEIVKTPFYRPSYQK